jgi:hypothetical protein
MNEVQLAAHLTETEGIPWPASLEIARARRERRKMREGRALKKINVVATDPTVRRTVRRELLAGFREALKNEVQAGMIITSLGKMVTYTIRYIRYTSRSGEQCNVPILTVLDSPCTTPSEAASWVAAAWGVIA